VVGDTVVMVAVGVVEVTFLMVKMAAIQAVEDTVVMKVVVAAGHRSRSRYG